MMIGGLLDLAVLTRKYGGRQRSVQNVALHMTLAGLNTPDLKPLATA